MGDEFRVHVGVRSLEEAESSIAKVLGGVGRRSESGWEFRAEASPVDGLPDATVFLQADGFLVVLHGGRRGFGAEVLGALVASGAGAGKVRVEEL